MRRLREKLWMFFWVHKKIRCCACQKKMSRDDAVYVSHGCLGAYAFCDICYLQYCVLQLFGEI